MDEDLPGDNNKDGAPGIIGIDDNGDGTTDVSSAPTVPAEDDDEDNLENEDYLDSLDNDSDGSLGEDYPHDMNHDNKPGVASVDDDLDGTVDEGHLADDDEDGSNNEDWFDPVVFFLSGTTLMERYPVTWDENNDTNIDGLDFVENPLADNVSEFRVERLARGKKKSTLVDITLTLGSGGDSFTLHTRTRAGDPL